MSSRPTPPTVPAKVAGLSRVSVAPAPSNVAGAPLAVEASRTSVALASISRPPVPAIAFCTVSVPPEATISPELARVVASTTPNPVSSPPAPMVSDDPVPVTVKVPPLDMLSVEPEPRVKAPA